MTSPAELEKLTVKQLTDLAKKSGVSAWRGLRKNELISAIRKQRKSKAAKKSATKQSKAVKSSNNSKKTSKLTQKKPSTTKSPAKSTKKTVKKTASSGVGSIRTAKKTVKSKAVPKTAGKSVPKKTPAAKAAPAKTVVNETKNVKSSGKPTSRNKTVVHTAPAKVPPPKSSPKWETRPAELRPIEILSAERGDSDFRLANLKKSLIKYRELSGVFDGEHKDKLVLMVRDPHWLHAFWELSAKLVERARAAMGAYWHTASPIIRLYRIVSDGISKQRRTHLRDIKLQGNVNNWYIDVQDPPACFSIEIGYVSSKGRFFSLASSNIVETPENHGSGRFEQPDGNWLDTANESERIFRLSGGDRPDNHELKEVFEHQIKRPISAPLIARFGGEQIETVKVDVEADVVIYGITQPNVQLTVKNEPIRVQPDGRFSVRFHLPEKRQVYPVVAVSSDGIESQTTILAIERNTKALETVYREHDELD